MSEELYLCFGIIGKGCEPPPSPGLYTTVQILEAPLPTELLKYCLLYRLGYRLQYATFAYKPTNIIDKVGDILLYVFPSQSFLNNNSS